MNRKTKRRIIDILIIVPPGIILGIVGDMERRDIPLGLPVIIATLLLIIWAAAVWKEGYWK